jgi:hypothetical protein
MFVVEAVGNNGGNDEPASGRHFRRDDPDQKDQKS